MSWAFLDDRFDEHPKVEAAGTEAAWLYVCGLLYSKRNNTDGFIPTTRVAKLVNQKHPARLAKRLVKVGLWEQCQVGFRIVGFQDGARGLCRGTNSKRLFRFSRPRNRPHILLADRIATYERDGYVCRRCGSDRLLSIDHVIPLSKGGLHHPINFQTLCLPCNVKKGVSL